MPGVLESSFVAGSVDAIDVWKKTIAALGENPSAVRFYGKSIQAKNLPGRLALRDGKQFNIEFDEYSIRFVFIAISDIFVLRVRGHRAVDWCSLAVALSEFGGFLNSRLFDEEYETWQNAESLQYYEATGRSIVGLAMKSNNLPPPLNAQIVDTSANAGRRVLRHGYIEAIGFKMWLGERFWLAVGREKEASISLLPVGTSVIDGVGFVLVIVGDNLLTEFSSAECMEAVRTSLFLG